MVQGISIVCGRAVVVLYGHGGGRECVVCEVRYQAGGRAVVVCEGYGGRAVSGWL
jgi:hypothetical protein